MTLRMLTPFFPFRLDCCGASGEGAETATGGVAHGGGFVGLHTLGSGSEALAAVNASAIDKAPLHISGAILKNGYLMSKLRQPSRILHDWRNILLTLRIPTARGVRVIADYDCRNVGSSRSSISVTDNGSTFVRPAVPTSSTPMDRYRQEYRGKFSSPPVGRKHSA